MDYKTTGLETGDHVGCFRFTDWLILWLRWSQQSGNLRCEEMVKVQLKYSKIIRIRVQLRFISIVLPLFSFASCNVFFNPSSQLQLP